MSKLTAKQRNALRTNIAEYFGLEELKTLCFDLGVKFDNLAGEGLDGKIVALILWFEERDRIPELIRKCRQERPGVHWGSYSELASLDLDMDPVKAALDRYYEQIIKQYGWIRIFGQTTPKPLKEVFTDVYMLDKPTAFSRFDPDALRKHLWDADRSIPFRYGERLPAEQLLSRGSKFFILGRPGAGKTTFLKHLAVREAERGKWGSCLGKVPIFIPLKQFAESGESLFDFIVEQFAVCHVPDAAPFVERLLLEGKALVLFDGLDEVARDAEAQADRRSQVIEQLEQFSCQYDGCHIVVTCRIAATEYTFDSAFIYLEMADFAPDQVDAFVRNWFWDPTEPVRSASLAERMLVEWNRSEHAGIRDLARSPLLLTLLCLNYAETLSFPARRVEIYQEALDALLKKWDSSRQIQRGSLYKTLSLGRKQQMFSRIAYDGFVQGEILFSQAELEARLKAYLAHVPEVPDAIDIDAEAVLAEIIEQHGVFAEQSRNLYSFAHLTFQEYYVAKYLAESLAPDALAPLMTRVSDDKWQEVFLLTASLLPDVTFFLLAFEHRLHDLIIPRLRLVAWLRWIDEKAAMSHAGYSRSATRVWYARTFDLDFDPELSPDFVSYLYGTLGTLKVGFNSVIDLSRSLEAARTRALEIALILDRLLAFDHALILAYDFSREHRLLDLTAQLSRANTLCKRLGNTALEGELNALVAPPDGASLEIWKKFQTQLRDIVRSSGARRRYGRLNLETEGMIEMSGARREAQLDPLEIWYGDGFYPLQAEDMALCTEYIRATRLFCDCLQLAYTPDRHAFEDRILLPPPLLTEQKA